MNPRNDTAETQAPERDSPGADESLLEFPCRFPVKAMGRNEDEFEQLVTGLVLGHARLFEGETVRTSRSAAGNYLSVTVVIEATSRAQLDRIYEDLTESERVLIAL